MLFESLAEIKNINIAYQCSQEKLMLWFDAEKMEIIISNLLSNAFKYTSEGGKVSMIVKEGEDHVELIVKDTGMGISADKLPYVFDRFFRVENTSEHYTEGSGIGLYLTKELVALHHGEIAVESTLKKGTTFTVKFKKGNQHFAVEELMSDNSKAYTLKSKKEIDALLEDANVHKEHEIDTENLSTQATILLVDDNTDVRKFIKDQLKDSFQIIEASDGLEGFELALEQIPELVISDVMMSGMDGFKLCSLLKQDVNTSHIPVILLTAKDDLENKLQGLELGADDYLTKPFNSKELNIRVKKLIELRSQLRQKLLEYPLLAYKSIEGNPVENKFIEQVLACIELHYSNPDFSVEMLADVLKMGRIPLNKKLKSITSLTANKYIQHIRLQKALILLETENLNVSEVAFQTGFNSVAYFVKCFREHFGKTPGAVQSKP